MPMRSSAQKLRLCQLLLLFFFVVTDGFSDVARKLLSAPTQLLQNAFDAYNERFYTRSVQQKLKIVKYDDEDDLVQLPPDNLAVGRRQAFLQKVLYSAKLSARIYSRNIMKPFAATPATKSMKQQVLSLGEDDKPDCIVRFVPNENIDGNFDTVLRSETDSKVTISGASTTEGTVVKGTLWVSVRGTATPYDAISNISWLTTTTPVGNYLLPTIIARRAQAIFKALIAFIEMELNAPQDAAGSPPPRRLEVTNIIFTGHSLGGAIATALYYYWQSYLPMASSMPGEVFTYGAPISMALSPSSQWYDSTKGKRSAVMGTDVLSLPAFFSIRAHRGERQAAAASVATKATNGRVVNPAQQNSNSTLNSRNISSTSANFPQTDSTSAVAVNISSVSDIDGDTNGGNTTIRRKALEPQVTAVCISSSALASRIYNVVYQLDPIPRIVGQQPLPNYIQQLNAPFPPIQLPQDSQPGKIAETLRSLMDFMRLHVNQVRQHYRPFGRYYQLANLTSIDSEPPAVLVKPGTVMPGSYIGGSSIEKKSISSASVTGSAWPFPGNVESNTYRSSNVSSKPSSKGGSIGPARFAGVLTKRIIDVTGISSTIQMRRSRKAQEELLAMAARAQSRQARLRRYPSTGGRSRIMDEDEEDEEFDDDWYDFNEDHIVPEDSYYHNLFDNIDFFEDTALWEQISQSFDASPSSRVLKTAGSNHVTAGDEVNQKQDNDSAQRMALKRKMLRNIRTRQGKRDILTLFADSRNDFIFSLLHDHSMRHTIMAIEVIMRQQSLEIRSREER